MSASCRWGPWPAARRGTLGCGGMAGARACRVGAAAVPSSARLAARDCRSQCRALQLSALACPQFERERSRALSKELLAARKRWQATEAERQLSEDARRWGRRGGRRRGLPRTACAAGVHGTPGLWGLSRGPGLAHPP